MTEVIFKRKIPCARKPVVDRLGFILPWGQGVVDQSKSLGLIKQRIQQAIDAGLCKRAYPKGGRYRENFFIYLHGRDAFVQIGALQPESQKGGIRVVLNPALHEPDDIEKFHSIMEQIVGRDYQALLKTPLINQIDFAIDVVRADLSDLLVSYNHAQRHTIFGKRSGAGKNIESYYFGSVSSDYQTVAYAKDVQLKDTAIKRLISMRQQEDSLKMNTIKQAKVEGPKIMRVEVRGKKMRGKKPWEIEAMPNRFSRFKFADLGGADSQLSTLLRTAFISMCRDRGVKAALESFKGSKSARKVRKFWKSRQAPWWKPALYWQQAYEALKLTGVFPDEAFERDG